MSSSRPQQWLPAGIGDVVSHLDRRLVGVQAAFGRITANVGRGRPHRLADAKPGSSRL